MTRPICEKRSNNTWMPAHWPSGWCTHALSRWKSTLPVTRRAFLGSRIHSRRPNCSPVSNFRSAQSYNSLMQRLFSVLLLPLCSVALRAEVHIMTLRQAVDRALEQNPDIALARLDEQKAQQAVRLTKAPFSPRIDAGSGLAYSSGFPMSIEGAAPSIVQARATAFVFNRQQSYLVAEARENARGASIATSSKRDEVAFRTASLYLDAQRAARLGDLARKEIESIQKVQQAVDDRVKEG